MSPARSAAVKKRKRRRKSKGPIRQNLELIAVVGVLSVFRVLPFWLLRPVAALAGEAIFWLVPRRRRIALENLRTAFPEKGEAELRRIARASCRSLVLTGLESAKYLYAFRLDRAQRKAQEWFEDVEGTYEYIRKYHRESGGCLYVVPHLGNWEFLAHAGTLAGVPLTIVVRPLDNPRLEKHLFGMRTSSGQQILSKRNSFLHQREALRKGRSVAILADQHAGVRGIDVPFFGKPASTTTVPAVLALHFNRPLVLVACVRHKLAKKYEVLLSEPIRPRPEADTSAEVERLTAAMNREFEAFIRRAPEQYFWLHDRWKRGKVWGRSEAFLKQKAREAESQGKGAPPG